MVEGPKEKIWWTVEYEIPPLRAIYKCECHAATEQEAQEVFEHEKDPKWRFRKVLPQDENSTMD